MRADEPKPLEQRRAEENERIAATVRKYGLSQFEERVLRSATDFLELTISQGRPRRYLPQVSLDPARADSSRDPRGSRNWRFFARLAKLCDALSAREGREVTPREFMRCCLWRGVWENPDWEVYPSMLATEWGCDRWMAYHREIGPERTDEDRRMDLSRTIATSRNYLAMRRARLNASGDLEALRSTRRGMLVPDGALWVFNGALSPPWCALSRSFWALHDGLPPDARREYLRLPEVVAAARKLAAIGGIAEAFGDLLGNDLVAGPELAARAERIGKELEEENEDGRGQEGGRSADG